MAQLSQQATGYEDQAVLKLYGYLNMVTALDPTDAVHPECMGELNGGLFLLPSMIMACVLVIFTVWGWLSFMPHRLASAAPGKVDNIRIHIL